MLDEEHLPKGKTCSTCKEWKPLEEFNKRSTSPDGRQWKCRECNKAYHYEHLERHLAQIYARKARLRAENKPKLWKYLLEHPCTDCGEVDPVVLEFDHIRDKSSDVTRLVHTGESWQRVMREIEKCEVVCANCHRRRTYLRQQSWRVSQSGP